MRIAFALVLTTTLSHVAAAAMPNAKPGLWETSSTIVMEAAPPSSPRDSKMTADERAKMQRSLSPHGGKPVISSDRMCMTPDMLERWEAFGSTSSAGCQRNVVERTAQRVQFRMACSGGSTGTAEFTAAGPDRIVGKMNMLMRNGANESKVDIVLESRWISADCGGLKPGERQVTSR
jgi:hypothetical protein